MKRNKANGPDRFTYVRLWEAKNKKIVEDVLSNCTKKNVNESDRLFAFNAIM